MRYLPKEWGLEDGCCPIWTAEAQTFGRDISLPIWMKA
jgi:hypothetical protein